MLIKKTIRSSSSTEFPSTIEMMKQNVFHQIVDNLSLRLFFIDTSFRLQGANRPFLNDMQFDPTKFHLDFTLKQIFPPEIYEPLCEGDHLLLLGYRQLIVSECRLLLPDGKEIVASIHKTPLYDQKGGICGIVTTYNDITIEKERQAYLKASLERLRLAEKQASMGYWDYDPTTRQIHWSEGMYKIFGYGTKRPTIRPVDIWHHLDPKDRNRVRLAFRRILRDPNHACDMVYRIRKADSETAYIHTKTHTRFDKGDAVWVQGICIDVTDQKQLEKENRQKLTMLMQRDKLAQMGELMRDITHQWKQPLAKINALLLDLEADWQTDRLDDFRFRHFYDELENLTTFMGETIDHFTSYARSEHPIEAIDWLEAFVKVQNLLARRLKKVNAKLIVDRDIMTKVWATKQDLIQLFTILCDNALDQFEKEPTQNPTITIRTQTFDRKVSIIFEDNGGGISKKIKDCIFDPYFTTKNPKSEGRGLGLFIARLIVQKRLDGTLTLQKTHPATFEISLKKAIDESL